MDAEKRTLDRLFIDFSTARLTQYTSEIERCLGRLSDEQVWSRGSENENSIANLVIHLIGNVRQRTAAITGVPFDRVRPEEFSVRTGWTSAALTSALRACMDDAIAALATITPERISTMVGVGDFHHTLLESVYHMTAHFALHTGQIIFATKMLTGADLGFYKPPAQPAAAH